MRPRPGRRVVLSLWACGLIFFACAHILIALSQRNNPLAPAYGYWLEATIGGLTFLTVGALVASRRRENVIGWMFLIVGLLAGFQVLSGEVGTYALFESGGSRGSVWIWASSITQVSVVAGFLFLILLFPTGTVVSPRWRPVGWLTGLTVGLGAVGTALLPGPFESVPNVRNPFGIRAAAPLLETMMSASGVGAIVILPAAALSLIVRLRRSEGLERLQLKAFVYVGVLGLVVMLLANLLLPEAMEGRLGSILWTVVPVSLPIAAGVAILRYRLYDIDLVINKTLVYASLTASLGAAYFVIVVVLQRILSPLAGGGDLAVAASTVAVAALFRPVRHRVQALIDRRFYRRKYDAKKTVEAFTARLRDEIELDTLRYELTEVVRETMQPAHVSLWLLRSGEGTR